jgi:hypothetical protein
MYKFCFSHNEASLPNVCRQFKVGNYKLKTRPQEGSAISRKTLDAFQKFVDFNYSLQVRLEWRQN